MRHTPRSVCFSSFMFFPSIQPSSFRACVNARTRRCACWSVSVVPARIPITGVDPLRSGQPRGQPDSRDRAKCCNGLAPSHCRPSGSHTKSIGAPVAIISRVRTSPKTLIGPTERIYAAVIWANVALGQKRTSAAQSRMSELKGPPRW